MPPIAMLPPTKERTWPKDLDERAKLDMKGQLEHRAAVEPKPSLREVIAEAQRAGGIIPARPAKPRAEVTREMIEASGWRIAEAERRAKEAEERSLRAEHLAETHEAVIRGLRRQLAGVTEAVARHTKGRPLEWQRACVICGAPRRCEHREPELMPLRSHGAVPVDVPRSICGAKNRSKRERLDEIAAQMREKYGRRSA